MYHFSHLAIGSTHTHSHLFCSKTIFNWSRLTIRLWSRTHTHTHTHTHTQLNLSHNQLQELHLRYLCLPGLEKLSIAHNCLSKIHTDKKVLERITYLNFSHNRLQSLNWIHAFVGVCAFNLSYNLLSQRLDLDKLLQMKKLNTVTLMGECMWHSQP